jgi:hypothetical protein
MPPPEALDASLLRFQADIDIRYDLSIVNVNLSKFDTIRIVIDLRPGFQALS